MCPSDALAFNLVKGGITDHAWIEAHDMKRKVKESLFYVGLYLGYRTIINFMNKVQDSGEEDWPGAIFDSFKDLTANTIKTVVGELFGKWIENCPKFREGVSGCIEWSLKKAFGNVLIDEAENAMKTFSVEAASKVVDELLGAGLADVFDGSFGLKDDTGRGSVYFAFPLYEHDGEKVLYCRIDLIKAMTSLRTGPLAPFNLIWDQLYGWFNGTSTPVSFPLDPEPPAKEEINAVMVRAKDIKVAEGDWMAMPFPADHN